jgi:hypothetical protein
MTIEGKAAEMEGNRQVQEIYLGISTQNGDGKLKGMS